MDLPSNVRTHQLATWCLSCGRRGKKLFTCVPMCTLPTHLPDKADLVLQAKGLVSSKPVKPLLALLHRVK